MRKPEGLWFGADHARCFGMLHHPESARPDAASTRGVVLCNAFGYEGLLSYRAMRHIADDVAARGQWALRFDYDGEGDSSGGAWEPDRVDAWLASIDAAVSVLRARGVTDVRLVGFRIGATLAARYATTHPGISGLALWAPCERGAAYVREQKVRARMSSAARPAQPSVSELFPEDSLEAVGFELTGETLRAIGEMDLVAEPNGAVPPSVLVIDRDDVPPADELVQKFKSAGANVAHEHMAGYEEFITDGEENAVTPVASIDLIVNWLDALPEVAAVGAGDVPLVVESSKLAIDDPTAGSAFTARARS